MAPTATTLDELFRALDLSLTLRASNEEEGAWACTLVRPDGATFEIESVTFFDVDPDTGEEWVVEPTPVARAGRARRRRGRGRGRRGRRGGRGDGRRPPSRSWATRRTRCCSGWTRRSSTSAVRRRRARRDGGGEKQRHQPQDRDGRDEAGHGEGSEREQGVHGRLHEAGRRSPPVSPQRRRARARGHPARVAGSDGRMTHQAAVPMTFASSSSEGSTRIWPLGRATTGIDR